MATGRHSPALFELLRGDTGTRQASIRPAAPQPQRPTPAAADAPAPQALPAPAPAPRAPTFKPSKPVTLSASAIWLGVGGAILLVVVVWAVAFKSGYSRAEREALRDIGQPAASGSAITEPLHRDIPVNPTLVSAPPQSPAKPAPAPAAPANTGGGDPRVPGMNYLVLAYKIDKELGERAGAFLAQNGVQTFMVARPGAGANNPGAYTLFALPGITPEEYRAQAPSRTDLQERVARLGKTWQKEHKGGTDFSRTTWEKFGS